MDYVTPNCRLRRAPRSRRAGRGFERIVSGLRNDMLYRLVQGKMRVLRIQKSPNQSLKLSHRGVTRDDIVQKLGRRGGSYAMQTNGLWFLWGLILGLVGGLAASVILAKPPPPSLAHFPNWTLIAPPTTGPQSPYAWRMDNQTGALDFCVAGSTAGCLAVSTSAPKKAN